MRLTIVHPCIGRRRGARYIRTWQMEPLASSLDIFRLEGKN